jgi:hypothetical protein
MLWLRSSEPQSASCLRPEPDLCRTWAERGNLRIALSCSSGKSFWYKGSRFLRAVDLPRLAVIPAMLSTRA